jgi:DNA sulfur modification protein DndD
MLRDQFLIWSEKGALALATQRDELVRMRRITSELRLIRQELDEAELTTDEAKAQFEELTEALGRVDKELGETIERIAEHRIDEQKAHREAAEHEQRAADLEAEHLEVARKNAEYQLAIRTKRALERYRDLRKAEVRASIEKRLNERVDILLAPSQLIRSVRLDDNFVMSYFDERKNEVARHSISAGMRQLLAMAMLWALKDEAERPLPVVVDTPLGRIDRTNRLLLMREYFPKAGNPLILLPTDSEFGPEGYEELADHISRRYRIDNEGGDSAQIVEETGR